MPLPEPECVPHDYSYRLPPSQPVPEKEEDHEDDSVEQKPDNELANSIRVLAWCIFWGLLLHGCATSCDHVSITDSGNTVIRKGP